MTHRPTKWLVVVLVVGAALFAVAGAGMYAEPAPVKSETTGQALRRAADQGALEAGGTWWTNDGKLGGKWKLCDGFMMSQGEEWSGAILVTQFDGSAEFDPAVPEPARQVRVVGWFDGNQMHMRGAPSPAGGSDSDESRPVFPGDAKAALAGVRIEGELVSRDGVAGGWEGWWHAWGGEERGDEIAAEIAGDSVDAAE